MTDTREIRNKHIWRFGRVRLGYVSPSDWVKLGYPIKNWFAVASDMSKFFTVNDDPIMAHCWQFTLLGFQFAIIYKNYNKVKSAIR